MNRRFSQGLRFQASWTRAKSIDNASGIGGGGLVVVQDENNIRRERSLSSFDQRHRLETGVDLALPFGVRQRFLAGANRYVQAVVSGWSLTANYQASSGAPLTARLLGNASNNSGTGSNFSERADATGAGLDLPEGARSTALFFNTLAFAVPPPGRFGNAGRNTIPGPGTQLLNASLRKGFRLDDRNRRLEFRWMVDNLLNHPNWSSLGTVVNSVTFGRITGVRSMRRMEFSLRIAF
jgi:hypothetical protein